MTRPVMYQRVEAAVIGVAAFLIFVHLHYHVVWFFVFLLSVDISILGYLINKRIGALIYNIGHSFIVPPILLAIGIMDGSRLLVAVALVWIAHIGLDRALGYGLKLSSGFKDTHLGRIG